METIEDMIITFKAYISDPKLYLNTLGTIIKISIIYLFSRMVIKIATKMVKHMIHSRVNHFIRFENRRVETLKALLQNLITYSVYIISIMLILSQLGINLAPLLAGAGIIGLAIGFGANSLVKDIITGFFIIFEDQFNVGDIIKVDQFKGKVEEIGIRTTKIKSESGEVLIIPNGQINQIVNYSIYHTVTTFDIDISVKSNLEQVLNVIEQISNELVLQHHLMAKPEIQGIQKMNQNQMTIRMKIECLLNDQFTIIRSLNALIKKKLDEKQIELS
jgi:small-conductance mechanosensitive channel